MTNPAALLRRVRSSLTLNRWRLEFLHRLKGGTLWTRRGGYWLPFHADGDLQEIQYQVDGELWFKYETERLREYLPKDGVVVDVGANLGFTALLFAKHVGPGGRIFAFEPSPAVYAKLLQVVEKNQLSNVQCFNLGCGRARSRETLLVPASSGNATIRRSDIHLAEPCREINIEIDALDHVILPLAPKIDLLKIDTEGFEDQVLAGAGSWSADIARSFTSSSRGNMATHPLAPSPGSGRADTPSTAIRTWLPRITGTTFSPSHEASHKIFIRAGGANRLALPVPP